MVQYMPKSKFKKFAQVKRLISPHDPRLFAVFCFFLVFLVLFQIFCEGSSRPSKNEKRFGRCGERNVFFIRRSFFRVIMHFILFDAYQSQNVIFNVFHTQRGTRTSVSYPCRYKLHQSFYFSKNGYCSIYDGLPTRQMFFTA
jgi:hypothetical protein